MPEEMRAFVHVWCACYGDSFPQGLTNRLATGREIFDFLIRDANLCFREEPHGFLHGDCALWYLGLTDHHGCLVYENHLWLWGQGQASFDLVEDFLAWLHRDGLLTDEHLAQLKAKVREGRGIKSIYEIGEYLLAKGRNQAQPDDNASQSLKPTFHSTHDVSWPEKGGQTCQPA